MKRIAVMTLLVLSGAAMADYAVVSTIDAPDTNISGLGFGNGSLWAVDGTTEYAYEVDPQTGAVINSWYIENTTRVPTGCTFANNTLYIACGTPPNITLAYCYKYTSAGAYSGMFSLDC
jgi:hypothetical protein